MPDLDRIYTMLKDQGELLAAIKTSQDYTHKRLFGGEGERGTIPHLYATVAEHGTTINRWKGALTVLSVIWTCVLAWGGVVISKHAK
jgi:hypothetical protein